MKPFYLFVLLWLIPCAVCAQQSEPQEKSQTQNQSADNSTTKVDKDLKAGEKIDWGDWNQKFKPQHRYGVGVKGKLQRAISELDKSNLLDDTSGVSTTTSPESQSTKKSKDIKKMKEELRALERKVKQEIESDGDY